MHPELGQVAAHVTCTRRKIQNQCASLEFEEAYGFASPTNVQTEGHDPVYEVVPGGNGVKHLLDGLDLFRPLGKLLCVPRLATRFRHELSL